VDSSNKPKILQQEFQLTPNCLNFCIPTEFGVYSALERRRVVYWAGLVIYREGKYMAGTKQTQGFDKKTRVFIPIV